MKRYFLALVALIATLGCSAAEMDDMPIEAKALPAAAQSFLKTIFPSCTVSYATKDVDFSSVEYKVALSCGYIVEFDSKGSWTEIDGKGKVLPDAAIPASVLATVKSRFPEQKITEISKDRGHYDVSLDNGLELEINSSGDLIRIDD